MGLFSVGSIGGLAAAGGLGALAPVAGVATAAGVGTDIFNSYMTWKNYQLQKKNLDYQKNLQSNIFAREDTAVQRRTGFDCRWVKSYSCRRFRGWCWRSDSHSGPPDGGHEKFSDAKCIVAYANGKRFCRKGSANIQYAKAAVSL